MYNQCEKPSPRPRPAFHRRGAGCAGRACGRARGGGAGGSTWPSRPWWPGPAAGATAAARARRRPWPWQGSGPAGANQPPHNHRQVLRAQGAAQATVRAATAEVAVHNLLGPPGWARNGHLMDILPTATRKGLHILWTSCGHPMDILWTSYLQRPEKVFTSYGHLVDILWTSYGHPAYSDQTRSSHPIDILWTFYGHPMDILPTATRKGLMDFLWTSYGHPMGILPEKVSTSYGHLVVDILWTSYGHPAYSDQKRSSHPMGILWFGRSGS